MQKMIQYKEYKAKIRFDTQDNIVVGEVIGIRDSINFHGRDEEEAIKMFHQSIDNYLDTCRKLDKMPDNPTKDTLR